MVGEFNLRDEGKAWHWSQSSDAKNEELEELEENPILSNTIWTSQGQSFK